MILIVEQREVNLTADTRRNVDRILKCIHIRANLRA